MINTPKRLRSPGIYRSRKQEEATAYRLGGRVTKASGASYEKGDVRINGVIRLEAKTTTKDSFRVTAEVISKIEMAALGSGELPVIEVELSGGKRRVYIIPTWALEVLIDRASQSLT